jgi:recombination protein RecT
MTNLATALVPIPQQVEKSLVQREEELRTILGDSVPVKRFIKTAVVAIAKNPDLQRCTIESLVIAIVEAAEVGIEPTGSLSRGWLVPFQEKGGPTKAQLIIGWMGLIDLAKDSGEVSKITARVVYEGDEFTVEQGTEERVVHVPRYATEDPEKIKYAYMVATMKDGSTVHEVMTKAQIDEVRSKAKARNGPAWTQSYPEMSRKTVVRRGVKYLHLTPRAIRAIERDDEREFGDLAAPSEPQGRTGTLKEQLRGKPVEETIEGTFTEVKAGEGSAPATDGADNGQSAGPPPPPPIESAAPQTKCGSLSDPALGDIEECCLAPGHLAVPGSQPRHRAESGSIWPAAKEK